MFYTVVMKFMFGDFDICIKNSTHGIRISFWGIYDPFHQGVSEFT